MPNDDENVNAIRNHGQPVPIIALYSVQGGVGKTTLAQKFAELITLAPGNNGRKPNVLVIDLDVDSKGLTCRWTQQLRHPVRTVHEMIAERNVAHAHALSITPPQLPGMVPPQSRGQIYLVPAATSEAKNPYDTAMNIDRSELLDLLRDLIRSLVMQNDISCVIIDCKPGPNPYAAAAAALADHPLLIGRNEPTSYSQIQWLPEKFREMYPWMQTAKQRVIINAVASKELYSARAGEYSIFDWIPLVSDVIFVTEGHNSVDSFRMLMFDKFVVEIIKRMLVGRSDLIPTPPEVVGQEWVETLQKLERCEEAPRMRQYRVLRHLRWVGAAVVLIGIAFWLYQRFAEKPPDWIMATAITSVVAGLVLAVAGFWVHAERLRILGFARELVINGPGHVLYAIQQGVTRRRQLDEMRKLANTIPEQPAIPYGAAPAMRLGE